MIGTANRTGICLSCRKMDECRMLHRAKQPVVECGEFQECKLRPSKRCRRVSVAGNRDAVSRSTGGGNGQSDLCVTCTLAKTCTFPKPEGGVWRCEEYK